VRKTNLSGVGMAAVIAAMALLAAACGSSGGVAEVSLAELTTDQDRYDEQLVGTEGIVRAFDDPRHFWIEDADLNRVELQPPGSVESHLGERIRVQGRFTFREDEGRRIAVDDVQVLDAAPEIEQIAASGGSYTRAAPGAFAPLLDAPDTLVINVHIPYEGEIEGTDASVPYDKVEGAAILPTDGSARIAVYCRSGVMSTQAAAKLVELGHTDVWELEGGMHAWDRSGRSLVGTDAAPSR
jgi:rhodanese-related sulfurtransferase